MVHLEQSNLTVTDDLFMYYSVESNYEKSILLCGIVVRVVGCGWYLLGCAAHLVARATTATSAACVAGRVVA